MRTLRSLILFIALVTVCSITSHARQEGPPPPPPPAPAKPIKVIGKAEVYYFKSKDKSEVQTRRKIYEEKKDGKLESLTLQARFSVTGQKIVAPDSVVIDFMTQTYEPKFATPEGRLFSISVDGENLGSGELSVVDSIKWSGGNHSEWAAAAFDLATFKKIASASKVRIRLGKLEFELKDVELEGLRDMLKAIEQ